MIAQTHCGSGFKVPGLGTVLYEENFDKYSVGSDPWGWNDTDANYSLLTINYFWVDHTLGNPAFYTATGVNNFHSHYESDGSNAWTDYEFRGRMRGNGTNAYGVTFYSGFSSEAAYYALKTTGGAFFLDAYPSFNFTGLTSTSVGGLIDTWYRFAIQVRNDPGQTTVRAKVWQDGLAEPSTWEIEAADSSGTRRTRGTIGAFANIGSTYYWDDLVVTQLDP